MLAILAAPSVPAAHLGVIFVHPSGQGHPTGAGLISVVTAAIERELITVRDLAPPGGALLVDTELGAVSVGVRVAAGTRASLRVTSVAYPHRGVRVAAAGRPFSVGSRRVQADLVAVGGLFAVVDAEAAAVPLAGVHPAELARTAAALADRIDEARDATWPAVEGVVFTGPPSGDAELRAFTVGRTGVLHVGPSGAAAAALLAVVHAMGLTGAGQRLLVEGPAGTCVTATLLSPPGTDSVDDGVDVEIEGAAWIVGETTVLAAADDPLAHGVRS